MAELEELEQETLDEQLLEVGGPTTDQLPNVPQAEPAQPAKGKSPSSVCLLTVLYSKSSTDQICVIFLFHYDVM